MSRHQTEFSNDFLSLVKAIGEAETRVDEDNIISNEIRELKKSLADPEISSKKMREYIIRAVYIEMLGYNASFMYIHAIKLAHSKCIISKKIGYLMCSLCLEQNNELLVLLINTIQQDLNSSNYLYVTAALTSIPYLLSSDVVQSVLPMVMNLLDTHRHELVRRKACTVLHNIYLTNYSFIGEDLFPLVRKSLLDPNPSVMGVSLDFIYSICYKAKSVFLDMVPSFLSILNQILNYRLPRDYEYHKVPAPWIQIKLLAILSILGCGDKKASEFMQKILVTIILKAECSGNIGYAILYEAIKTATSIYPSKPLLNHATHAISRFISYNNHNLKYVGISGLESIVRIHPLFASQKDNQFAVLECLEGSDETLKRKTLDLLVRITNKSNVKAVVDKLLHHLDLVSDLSLKKDLVSKICRILDHFVPDHFWYVEKVNILLKKGGKLIPQKTINNLFRLIIEGPTANDETDLLFRKNVVTLYLNVIDNQYYVSEDLMKISAWVLGEYSHILNVNHDNNIEYIIKLLIQKLSQTLTNYSAKSWVLSAIMKLTISDIIRCQNISDYTNYNKNVLSQNLKKGNSIHSLVKNIISEYSTSNNTFVHQITFEYLRLFFDSSVDLSSDILGLLSIPKCNRMSDDELWDENLHFLNDYVTYSIIKKKNINSAIKSSKVFDVETNKLHEVEETSGHTMFSNYNPISNDVCLGRTYSSDSFFEKIVLPITVSKHNDTQFSNKPSEILLGNHREKKWGPNGYNYGYSSRLPTPNCSLVDNNKIQFNENEDKQCEYKKMANRESEANILFTGLNTLTVNFDELDYSNNKTCDSSYALDNLNLLECTTNSKKMMNADSLYCKSYGGVDVGNPEMGSKQNIMSTSIIDSNYDSVFDKSLTLYDSTSYIKSSRIDISEAERIWIQLSEEKKILVSHDQKTYSPNSFFNILQEKTDFFVVKIIEDEAILSYEPQTNEFHDIILCHIKMNPNNKSYIILKGNDKGLLQKIVGDLKQLLINTLLCTVSK